MKKYILAFLITIPILMVVWIMVDFAEESESTYNGNTERSEDDQAAILQETVDQVTGIRCYSVTQEVQWNVWRFLLIRNRIIMMMGLRLM